MALRAEDIDMSADRTLVERYQAGDGRAFDELYGRHSDRLRTFCQRKVSDRYAAEEIAQDAFVKALAALPRFAGEMRFYPWLTVIASRLCVDHFRRQGRVSPSDEIDLGVVDEDLGRALVHQAEIADLDVALGRITERHRTVLDLRERRGLSYAEIAEDLAVPQTTVETLLFRARKALRREYLAVSGEPSRLAGIPVVGWLGARLRSLRLHLLKLRPELADLIAPVAAGAAAVAISAGVAISGSAGSPLETRLQSDPAAAAPAPTPVVVPPAAAPVTPPAAAPVTPAPPVATTRAPATQGGGDDVGPTVIGPGATVADDAGSFEDAEDMPVATNFDPATVGADPALAVESLLTDLYGRTP